MVQKRARGRPRAYDPDEALTRSADQFWSNGFAGTSLDDLSTATGMNRPSLYGAFGDKRALYIKALDGRRKAGRAALETALAEPGTLRSSLGRTFRAAATAYADGAEGPRGCFLVSTALTPAMQDVEIQAILQKAFDDYDRLFTARFEAAVRERELPEDAEIRPRAQMATAMLHSLSVRARSGESLVTLDHLADATAQMLSCPMPGLGA